VNPFQLSSRRISRVVERLLGLTTLERLYRQMRGSGRFAEQALRVLDIGVTIDGDVKGIPPRGAVVVIANHPGGAVDGLALLEAVRRQRSDVKPLANHLIGGIPELRDQLIAVNPFRPASHDNVRGLRQARRWLAAGGAVIVFPAARSPAWPTRTVTWWTDPGRLEYWRWWNGQGRTWSRCSCTGRTGGSSGWQAGFIRWCGRHCSFASCSLAEAWRSRYRWAPPSAPTGSPSLVSYGAVSALLSRGNPDTAICSARSACRPTTGR
jgi:hypothetical protein